MKRQNNLCLYCGILLTEKTCTLDHIVAISKGGRGSQKNLVAACMPCNLLKSNFTTREEVEAYCKRVVDILEKAVEFKRNGYRMPVTEMPTAPVASIPVPC